MDHDVATHGRSPQSLAAKAVLVVWARGSLLKKQKGINID